MDKALSLAKKANDNVLIGWSLYYLGKAKYNNYLYNVIDYFEASNKYFFRERYGKYLLQCSLHRQNSYTYHNRGGYEGSGIGLAIVKLVIEKLNGTIKVESEEDKGSYFVIKLLIA